MNLSDTIVAPSTPPGVSAIAVIRLSGEDAIDIVDQVFEGKDLAHEKGYTMHFGKIKDGDRMIDEVMVSLFRAPHSFTRENSVEISTHGSPYIVKEVVKILTDNGARMAEPGEFTRRAFLNGRFDLAQAEAVADLIHSDSETSHKFAINQMRGGISANISELREKLVHFASMVELELDFGEEDVEFADRDDLKVLIEELSRVIRPLIESFDLGNAVKNGVPVVIAGKPNAGKSTLLNALLNEEKAIVSEIAGTTRDVIEDEIQIEGIHFRFIDTAGLRDTTDTIESIGVERAKEQMSKASLILFLFDASEETEEGLLESLEVVKDTGLPYLVVGNKVDKLREPRSKSGNREPGTLPADRHGGNGISGNSNLKDRSIFYMSASNKDRLDELKGELLKAIHLEKIKQADTVVTNVRHYNNLVKTQVSLERVLAGLDQGLSGDLLAEDIRMALQYLGEITGEVTNDEILGNIFSKFCIGK